MTEGEQGAKILDRLADHFDYVMAKQAFAFREEMNWVDFKAELLALAYRYYADLEEQDEDFDPAVKEELSTGSDMTMGTDEEEEDDDESRDL